MRNSPRNLPRDKIKIPLAALGLLLLAACQPATPTASTGTISAASLVAQSTQLLDTTVGDLIDNCIATATVGTSPDPALFAARGFTQGSLLGATTCTRPVGGGSTALASERAVMLVFPAPRRSSNLVMIGVGGGVFPAIGWVQNRLEDAGYQLTSEGRAGKLRYERDGKALTFAGSQVYESAVIVLQRAR